MPHLLTWPPRWQLNLEPRRATGVGAVVGRRSSNPLLVASLAAALLLLGCPLQVHPETADRLPQVQEFIADMAARHGFDRDALTDLFHQVVLRPDIIETISRPAEAKPWYQYRRIFLTRARVEGGVEFWRRNRDSLARAQQQFGVDPAIIVAIIGVETRYGGNTGAYRVMDALTTLAFKYPKRGSFFRSELEHYLLMTRAERIDPLSVKGSYAGAMGFPQFIPSSFMNFAIDFDGDGRRDLWDEPPADAIGSVANYLYRHGWQADKPVVVAVRVADDNGQLPTSKDYKPTLPLSALKSRGIATDKGLAEDLPAALIRLDGQSGPEYWAGFQNFYAITRYNHSPLYAMAVYQLSQEIERERRARGIS